MLLQPLNEKSKNYNWQFPEIDLNPPKIGDKISAFGFLKMHSTFENDITKWNISSGFTTGTVKDIHIRNRDNSLYTFPTIQTNAYFAHGMSGGPVYNNEGRLFAIISGGLDATSSEEEHVFQAALIWPSLRTEIHGFLNNKTFPIYKLFNSDHMRVKNIDSVDFSSDKDNIGFTYHF